MGKIKMNFTNEFSGSLITENGTVKIGHGEGTFVPYELLMGALGSCLYATFLSIVKKMQLEYSTCDLEIEWEKREEVPTTCKLAVIKAKIVGADLEKKDRYQHAFKLATEYCSVYNTVSKVAEMKYELEIE